LKNILNKNQNERICKFITEFYKQNETLLNGATSTPNWKRAKELTNLVI